MTDQESIKNMSFEEALQELEQIVKKIDAGTEDLDSAINSFEFGVLLRKHCENKLEEARLKIAKITQSESGAVQEEKIDL